METMYPAKVNSPATALLNSITDTDTEITVADGAALPDAPNLCTIGSGPDAETILYTDKTSSTLTCTRGFQGTAKNWPAGARVARNFTAYDHDKFKENIEEIDTTVTSHLADYTILKQETQIIQETLKDRVIRVKNPTVVCYGDSNTRYYLGDSSSNGQIQSAFSTVANVVSLQFSNIAGANFINEGYLGKLAGAANIDFETIVTPHQPNVVVLSFGTNNVKDPAQNLETYITNMESMINKTLSLDALPIVLTIPDYADDYASDGVAGRERIVVWNEELYRLCKKYNIPVIDVYSMFNSVKTDQHNVWYNETTTPWRHFSAYAHQIIAHNLCKILSVNSIYAESTNEFKYSIGRFSEIFHRIECNLKEIPYNLVENRFSTINLLNATAGQFLAVP